MSPESTSPRVHRFEPPLRRVLAVDAGTRCIRLLLLESRFGRLRLCGHEQLDLQEEGLVAAEELQAHLHQTLMAWGRPPVALTISQQVAVAQLIQLPPVSDAEARQLIAAETFKLAGLGESAVVHDFCRVPVDRPGRQGFWITFAQETEIEAAIARLGFGTQEFREISTTANALLTAWQTTQPPQAGPVMLVDLGATATTVALVQQGHGVFAASFPVAGDYFTQTVARLRQCSLEQAEITKRKENLLTGPHAEPGFIEVVRNWAAELQRQLQEWSPASPPRKTEVLWVASGGGFAQPGLREFLTTHVGLQFQSWPAPAAGRSFPAIPAGAEIAYGTALLALRCGPISASLLPDARRRAWRQRLNRQRWEFANTLLLGVVLLVLLAGLAQKFAVVQHKAALLEKVQAGLEAWQQQQQLSAELVAGYDQLRPLLEKQQATHDTLQSLALLPAARTNLPLWFVLVADQQSYFALPAATATNRPLPELPAEAELGRRREVTNASPARPGLIAELSMPGDAATARSNVSLVVNALKRDAVFGRVDLLSEDLRRTLADPKVVVPERHFALALDFAETAFQPVARRARGSLTNRPGRFSGSGRPATLDVATPASTP